MDRLFEQFMALCEWLWTTTRQTHGIALVRLFELVLKFVKERKPANLIEFAQALGNDYRKDGRTDKPSFLAGLDIPALPREAPSSISGSERQLRHRVASA